MRQIPFPTTNGTILLAPNDICYLYPQGSRYCWLVLQAGKKLLVKGTVDHFESELKRPPFLRVHPEYIVNQKFIQRVLTGNELSLEMINQDQIPVSNRYFEAL